MSETARIQDRLIDPCADDAPDRRIDTQALFGVSLPFEVFGFSQKNEFTPVIDPNYSFDPVTIKTILAGFAFNKRVFIHGLHGSGKSTHIEQAAARLNWACVRLNLDGQIGRADLIGKDAIILRDSKQVTEFREGVLPVNMRRPCALVFDEYDAGRPEIMFVIQRLLENDGKLLISDAGRLISPHPYFRIFATANTSGSGDSIGLYHGTQQINQAQTDRWSMTVRLDYPAPEREAQMIFAKNPAYHTEQGKETIKNMVKMAGLARAAFQADEISSVLSSRALLEWAENNMIFKDCAFAFRISFYNRCDETDHERLAEMYQRCFGVELFGGTENPQT